MNDWYNRTILDLAAMKKTEMLAKDRLSRLLSRLNKLCVLPRPSLTEDGPDVEAYFVFENGVRCTVSVECENWEPIGVPVNERHPTDVEVSLYMHDVPDEDVARIFASFVGRRE